MCSNHSLSPSPFLWMSAKMLNTGPTHGLLGSAKSSWQGSVKTPGEAVVDGPGLSGSNSVCLPDARRLAGVVACSSWMRLNLGAIAGSADGAAPRGRSAESAYGHGFTPSQHVSRLHAWEPALVLASRQRWLAGSAGCKVTSPGVCAFWLQGDILFCVDSEPTKPSYFVSTSTPMPPPLLCRLRVRHPLFCVDFESDTLCCVSTSSPTPPVLWCSALLFCVDFESDSPCVVSTSPPL